MVIKYGPIKMESGEKEPIEKEKKIEICNGIHAELMATIQKFPKSFRMYE